MFRKFWIRFITRLRRRDVENEMDDELRFHLDMQIEKNIERGMNNPEARRQAMLQFGGLPQVKEECRDARIVRWLDETQRDLRYAFQSLRRKPGFTATVTLTLALGIGVNTAIFSVVNCVLLRPLPYRNAERLVTLLRHTERNRDLISFTSPADLEDFKSRSDVFEDAAVVLQTEYRVINKESPERVAGVDASANLFALLGIKPALGRLFLPEDGEPGSDPIVVLSYSYWLSEMGGDPGTIGRKLTIDGKVCTVVGVLPADFKGMFGPFDWKTMIWTPDGLRVPQASGRNIRQHVALAHLKPGVNVRQAQIAIDAISAQLALQYPQTNAGLHFTVLSLHERIFGDTRAPLMILMAAVGFVLLIACANVANMLLARSMEREKEIAVRAALGAGRWRVMRQLLAESMLLSVSGGAVGILFAVWSVTGMRPVITGVIPTNDFHVDIRALGFALALSVLTGMVFGLLLSGRAARLDLAKALKDVGRRSSAGPRSRVLRHSLVVAQVALSLVLLLSAGLMLNSLIRLLHVDPGFKTTNLLCTLIQLPRTNSEEPRPPSDPLAQVMERVRAMPGIQEAALVSSLPLGDSPTVTGIRIEGRASSQPGEQLYASSAIVSPEYFRLLRLGLLRGRILTEHDTRDASPVVVINETMAKTLWPNENPLGRRILLGQGERAEKTLEVVGVVTDARQILTLRPLPQFFQSCLQTPFGRIYLVARTSSSAPNFGKTLQEAIQVSDRRLVVETVRTMEQATDRYFVNPRFYASLFGIFAAVALLLALVGIYGVMSYTVTQRTHEIGVRMAFGARARDILRLVIGQGMLVTSIGLAVGLGASLALTHLLKNLVALYDVSATDPATFAGLAVLFAMTALPACYLPARRAMKVEPVIAVRNE
jgi:putative ABC transport system permease protein